MRISLPRKSVGHFADAGRERVRNSSDLAKDKVTDVADLTKSKIDETAERLQDLLPRRRRSSKLRLFFVASLVVAGALALLWAQRKRMKGSDDYSWKESHDAQFSSGGDNENASASFPPASSPPPSEATTPGSMPAEAKESDFGRNGTVVDSTRTVSTAEGPDETARLKLDSFLGMEVVDVDGASIGQVERIYYRHRGWEPEWVAVSTGLFEKKKKKTVAIPLAAAKIEEKIVVPYPKGLVENAPDLVGDEVSDADEVAAYEHYSLRRELPASVGPLESENLGLRGWSRQETA